MGKKLVTDKGKGVGNRLAEGDGELNRRKRLEGKDTCETVTTAEIEVEFLDEEKWKLLEKSV